MTISVIMANYQGAAYLDAAIASVLRQTHEDLELLVADDASTDGSAEILTRWQGRDKRVVPLLSDRNQGAAAARNRCLAAARGDWIAVVDSDDLLHPDRLRRMLSVARDRNAAFVADDMLFISDAPEEAGQTLLQSLSLCAPRPISAQDMVLSDVPGQGLPPLGYLKPLIARAAIGGLRYDETLQVSEDFDFYLRILIAGPTALLLPEPTYGYRRHAGSLSHRLSVEAVTRMIAAQPGPSADMPAELTAAMALRDKGLRHKLAYETLVAAVKKRQALSAGALLLRRPGLLRDLRQSVTERLARRTPERTGRTDLKLSLGEGPTGDGMHLRIPQVPAPGGTWSEPPAPIAARLSALAAAHDLNVQSTGASGDWALGLLFAQADDAARA